MLSEVLKRCEAVLRHRDVYYSGELCAELQCAFEEISRSTGRPSAAVQEDVSSPQEGMAGFSRVIVLDARRAVTSAGLFDFDIFIEVIARAIAEALGFDLDARNLHREQLSQFLKDERDILFCFFSLDRLTEEHYRQLRGLGFTQTDHRILFCGRSEFLRRQSTSLAESLDSEEDLEAVQFDSGTPDDDDDAAADRDHTIAHVRILTGRVPHAVHVFSSKGASIGRLGGDCDLVVDDGRMSRRHARIERSADGWHLQDLGALNRGFVNGRGYNPGDSVPLTDGAVLHLGDTLMVFRASPPINDGTPDAPSFPGVSPVAVAVRRRIDALVAGAGHVLIMGETGAGKRSVAQAISKQRAPHPFVTLNSALLSRDLARSELFGHVRGAFTNATGNKPGLVDIAGDGVLFLDEIGELSLDVQAELLRFLEDGTYRPLGSTELRHSSARVVAATHVDLEQAVRAGRFRSDLLTRLRASNKPLELPALRERREDILGWTQQFFRQHKRDPGPQPWTVGALECLLLYPWNHNLRELRSVVGQAAENAAAFPCGTEHLPAELCSHRGMLRAPISPTPVCATAPPVEPTQAEIEDVLRQTQGNMRLAAQRLNTDRRKLYRMCERFGIRRDAYRGEPVSEAE